MKHAFRKRIGLAGILLFALGVLSFAFVGCRTNEPGIPPLVGPSGARLFLTMEANPDHLLIRKPGNPPAVSNITIQLKNQLGVGVKGEHIRVRITNREGFEVAIGTLSAFELITDSAGFARSSSGAPVQYIAPTSAQQPASVSIFLVAILTNPEYPFQVQDVHELNLNGTGGNPPPGGACGPGALNPDFTFLPGAPVVNQQVCFTNTTTSSNSIVAVKWSFGDGSTSTASSPCHAFDSSGSFAVTLTEQDADQNVCSAQHDVVVAAGAPPSCTIVTSPGGTIFANETIHFTAIPTDADSPAPHSFSWNFGDGTITHSSRPTIDHKYKFEGQFNVILTVFDDQGNQGICQTAITVTSTSTPPVCSFAATNTAGKTFAFDASASSDDGTIVTFAWDFGDGSSGNGVTTSHTYGAAITGSTTVTLTVTDDTGQTSTCNATVVVP